MRPNVGFNPGTPQNAAGPRTDPPVSVPRLTGPNPAATAAALPLLDPPEKWDGFQGLAVLPNGAVSLGPAQNSSKLALPRSTAPASAIFLVTQASVPGRRCSNALLPHVVRMVAVSMASLSETGIP